MDLATKEGHIGCIILLLPEGENGKEMAKALIEDKKSKMKDSAKAGDSAALPETPQDSKPTLTDAVQDEVMSLATKVTAMSVSNEDKKRSLEIKAEGNEQILPRKNGNKVWNSTRQPLK